MIEYEKRFKLNEELFNKIKILPLQWSDPYKLTDIVFSTTGDVDIDNVQWIVRLREIKGNVIINYKTPLNKELTMWEEVEIQVNNFSNAMKFLVKIGLSPGLVLDRMRRDCIWDNFKLALDDFRHIGHFLEIEIDDPNKHTNFNLFSTQFGITL
jgi:predicted adenylyl cyclase CyaB